MLIVHIEHVLSLFCTSISRHPCCLSLGFVIISYRSCSPKTFNELVDLGADLTHPGVFLADGRFRFGPPLEVALHIQSKNGKDPNWTEIYEKLSNAQRCHDLKKLRKMSVKGRRYFIAAMWLMSYF